MNSKIIYALSQGALMLSILFIPLLAREFGASDGEIGLIIGAAGGSFFVSSYVFGRASDMYGRKKFIVWGSLIASIAFFLQIFASDVLSLALTQIFAGVSLGVISAPIIAYAHDLKKPMGNFNSYGSLGWTIGILIASIVSYKGAFATVSGLFVSFGFGFSENVALYKILFVFAAVLLFIAFVFSLGIKDVGMRSVYTPLFNMPLLRKGAVIYLPFLLRNTGANAVWAIFPLYLCSLGADEFAIGLIYFVNSGFQVIVMRYLDKVNRDIIGAGLLLSFVSFFLYGIVYAARFDSSFSYYLIFPIQFVLAVSFATLYVGSTVYLLSANKEKAASIGMLNSVSGLSSFIGPILGGIVLAYSADYAFLMGFSAILCVLGMIAYTVLTLNISFGGRR